MVPRYARPAMRELWSEDTRYRIWLEIETLAAEAMAGIGAIPREAARAIRERGGFDAGRIAVIESEVRHDVIAFLTSVAEHVGPGARYLHQGMTSSDLLDTALAVRLTRAADILIAGVDRVLAVLGKAALRWKDTPCAGRSHGMHADITSFGLKMAQAWAEFSRGRARLVTARAEVATAMISGAVGTYALVDPRIEEMVAARLGLAIEPVSSQVIPRDRHAAFFAALALVAASVERLATEIRHLQRTEVGEVEEPFAPGQKGSSAMPHKRNPVLCENLTGLSRLVRAALAPALENVVLWHERDISHSAVERAIAPEATTYLDFALARLADLLGGMRVNPDRMRENISRTAGLMQSQKILLALTGAGMSREDAYRLVQTHAMAAGPGGDPGASMQNDPEVTALIDPRRLADILASRNELAQLDRIYARLFGNGPREDSDPREEKTP